MDRMKDTLPSRWEVGMFLIEVGVSGQAEEMGIGNY